MALKYVLAALAVAGAKAQTTDDSNFYSLTDDYFATRRSSSVKTSMFWTVTQRYMDWVSMEPYTYAGSTTTYEYTYTRTIKASVTPTVTATYSTAYVSTNADVELHQVYYPTGAVAESDLMSKDYYDGFDVSSTATATTKSTWSTTDYYMPVTMTAPASCPTVFTVATQAALSYIPSIVTDLLQPSSTTASTSEDRSYVYEYATWYLTEGAAPFTSSLDTNYYYYISSCTPPPASYTGGSRTTGGSGGSDDGSDASSSSSGSGDNDTWTDYRACYFGGCTSLKTWIIIIATVLPGIFLLGFLESWFWYTRLMKGKSAMRCGTICWILLSLLVLCFTRMQDARSKQDQAVLQQKWKEMSAGQKFRNWSWGFKRRYPVPLLGQFSKQTVGIVPEGQPLHPAMAQAPAGQVFYYGPPPGAQGWQQGPGGAQGYPMPPQGYAQEYYARNVPKEGVVVGSASVPGTATPPRAPHPVYQPPTSPPPSTQLPPQPQTAPVLPPVARVSEAPAETREGPAASAPSVDAPRAPPVEAPRAPASEAPEVATTPSQPTQAAPVKRDESDDDLYK